MKIDDQSIDKLASLSRLEFEGEAKESIKKDLTKILDFVEKLNEIDTEGVESLIYMTDGVNVLRDDNVSNDLDHGDALKNAPVKDSDYFKVPKVLKS